MAKGRRRRLPRQVLSGIVDNSLIDWAAFLKRWRPAMQYDLLFPPRVKAWRMTHPMPPPD